MSALLELKLQSRAYNDYPENNEEDVVQPVVGEYAAQTAKSVGEKQAGSDDIDNTQQAKGP